MKKLFFLSLISLSTLICHGMETRSQLRQRLEQSHSVQPAIFTDEKIKLHLSRGKLQDCPECADLTSLAGLAGLTAAFICCASGNSAAGYYFGLPSAITLCTQLDECGE
jgi:hypothetical protein